MTTFTNIELTCPICGTMFPSRRITSTNSVGQDSDFRPRVIGIDPQPYYVHVCPNCFFSAFEGDYVDAEESVRDLVNQRLHRPIELVPDGQALALTGSAKYLLAARCYDADSRASDLRIADLYLRASWCARQEGLPAREREAQCDSIMLFEKALDEGEVADNQLRTILYLLGELYRRVGRYELAIAMFDQAMEAPVSGEDPDRFEVLVLRQRTAAEAGNCENLEIASE